MGQLNFFGGKLSTLAQRQKKTCANIESFCGINKSLSVNQRPALQGESARETSCQNTSRKSFSDRETIDVKAVVNLYENSHEIIIPRNRLDSNCVDTKEQSRGSGNN